MTKNFVDVAFHAARCALDGMRYDLFTMPGRVDPSVTRSIGEPNVGSANWNPAAPSCGSAGLVRASRSVIAEYWLGGACATDGGGAWVVNDHTGPAVVPPALRATICQ